MRKQPEISPQNVTITPRKHDDIITQVREYKLITPLFGGGVTAGERDPITLIRGTEIRGLLRFWWRACRAGNYTTIKDLKEAEDKIWGAANKNRDANEKMAEASSEEKRKGTVQIAVEQISEGTPDTPFEKNGKEKRNQRIAPVYAAFPLQPSDDDKRNKVSPKNVLQDVRFKLTISFHKDFQEEIKAALWAWETFGGIGARTRRGFGALQLLKIYNKDYSDLPFANELLSVDKGGKKNWLEMKLTQHVVEGTPPKGVPHLSRNIQYKVKYSSPDPFVVWNSLIKRLSSFRQFPMGRDKRSKWPEAEAIRGITGDRDSKYPPLSHPQKFPRAAFGLPIVFHFRKDDIGDPDDTTLQRSDKEKERLASPLILRPFVCKDGKAVGLVLLLEGRQTYPDVLELVNENKQPYSVTIDTKLTPAEAKDIPALDGETDVLKAFMEYL